MNRCVSRVFFLLMGFIILSLQGCGSSSTESSPNPSDTGKSNFLPAIMAKQLDLNRISGVYQVYDRNGSPLAKGDMQYNPNTNEMFSGFVPLDIGVGYRWLVTINYDLGNEGIVPIAVVGLVVDVDGVENVKWEDKDVLIDSTNLSEAIKNAIPAQDIPSTDPDGDGVLTYYEVIAGSNPKDPQSQPAAPERVGDIVVSQLGTEDAKDQVVIDMEFEDPLGVKDVSAENPQCGYPVWEITPVGEDGTRVHLHAIFNTHTMIDDDSKVTLTVRATNKLGYSTTYSAEDVEYEKTKDSKHPLPEIAFIKPRAQDAVSGVFQVDVIACDEGKITSLGPVTEEGKAITQDVIDKSDDLGIFSGTMNSEQLADGDKQLYFKATSELNPDLGTIRSISVLVDNHNPIEIQNPPPGSDIRGVVTLQAQVNKTLVPDVEDLTIDFVTSDAVLEGQPDTLIMDGLNLALDEDHTPEGFKKSLDTRAFDKERKITVRYTAHSPNKDYVRLVDYKINNDPDILYLRLKSSQEDKNPCLEDGTATLEWNVDNWGLDGGENGSNVGLLLLNGVQLDGPENWIPVGNREISCKTGVQNFNLQAKRLIFVQDGIQIVQKSYTSSKQMSTMPIKVVGLHSGMGLSPDDDKNFYEVKLNTQGKVLPVGTSWDLVLSREWLNDGEQDPGDVLFEKVDVTQSITIDVKKLLADYPNIVKKRMGFFATVNLYNSKGEPISSSKPYKIAITDTGMSSWIRFAEREKGCGDPEYWHQDLGDVNQEKSTPAKWLGKVCDWANWDVPEARILTADWWSLHWSTNPGEPEAIDMAAQNYQDRLNGWASRPEGSQEEGLTVEALIRVDPEDLAPDTNEAQYLVNFNSQYALQLKRDVNTKDLKVQGIIGTGEICDGNGFWGQEDLAQFKKVESNTPITEAKWYHLAFVYDPKQQNLELSLYINGIVDPTKEQTGGALLSVNNNCNHMFAISAIYIDDPNAPGTQYISQYLTDDPFAGAIADIAIYKRALTQGEIADHHDAICARYPDICKP